MDSSNSSNNNGTVSNISIIPPTLEPLNVRSDNMVKEWSHWRRSFERYCRLTKNNSEETRKDIFFSFIGRDIEDYLRDLPDFDSLDTINKLMDKVGGRYIRTPNTLCERFQFRKILILPNESISEFNARLNTFSKNCNFHGYSRELAHLDQIILNSPPKLRERLLMEKDLNLNKAIEIATFAAEGSKWANEFRQNSEREVNFNKQVGKSGNSRDTNSSKNERLSVRKCFRCGSPKHVANAKDCPAHKVTCHVCSKVGHFAKYCLNNKRAVKTVSVDDENECKDSHFNVLSVESSSSSHKYLKLKVNGSLINFIVDSGSQATLLPMNTFKDFRVGLKPTSVKLLDYNGNNIPCLGECNLNIQYKTNKFNGRVFVTENAKPLLGNDWIRQLSDVNWNELLVGTIKTESSTDDILSEFSEVFESNPFHKVKNKVAHLVLKSTAKPKFYLPRNVPLAINGRAASCRGRDSEDG